MADNPDNATNGKKRSAPADNDLHLSKRVAPRPAYKSLKETDFKAFSHGGRYSDLLLKYKEETWEVHKFVLCTQSDFFGTCVESGMKESVENIIELKDENLELEDIKRMLEFLYTGNFWEHPEEERDDGLNTSSELPYQKHRYSNSGEGRAQRTDDEKRTNPLIVLFRMSVLADKFGISGLQNEILKKMEAFRDLNTEQLQVGAHLGEEHCGSNFLRNWLRILDALEFCCSDLGSQPHIDKLADILLIPIARMAPSLLGINSDGSSCSRKDLWKNIMEGNHESWWFRDLQHCLEANPILCSRLFQIVCFEVFSAEQERTLGSFLEKQDEIREEAEKALHMAAFVLRNSGERDLLRCRRPHSGLSASYHGCSSNLPMVPCWGAILDDETSLIAFKCLDCNYATNVEDIIEEYMSLEELRSRFPVQALEF